MTTKVVYFTVGGKPEQAEFASDFPADEVKGSPESLCWHVHFYSLFVELLWRALVTGFILMQTCFYSNGSFIHHNNCNCMIVEGNICCSHVLWLQCSFSLTHWMIVHVHRPSSATHSRFPSYLSLYLTFNVLDFLYVYRFVSLRGGSWAIWHSKTVQHQGKSCQHIASSSGKFTRISLQTRSCCCKLRKLWILR